MKINALSTAILTASLATATISAQAADIKVGGRIHLDYTDSDNGTSSSEDLEFRRVRIAAKGNVAEDWKYKVQVEFDTDAEGGTVNENDAEEVDFKDVYMTYTGFGKMANITAGQQKEPFSLQALTSSNDITLLSRSKTLDLVDADDRNVGLKVHGSNGLVHYAAGLFRQGREVTTGGDTDVLWALTGRLAVSPINEDNTVLHLGIAVTDRDGGETGDDADAFNLEAAFKSGPFSVQGEYQDGETGNTDVDGYYVQVAYTLTGESRPYKGGKFKRIKPQDGAAIEIAARTFDKSEGTVDSDGYVLGVNSYLNKNVKIGLQFTDYTMGGVDADELRLRGQLTF